MHDDRRDERHEPRGPDDARQQQLDFVRGEQLRLLQDAELPKQARDKTGHGVRASALKALLTAIDHYGRGRSGGAFASVRTLAAAANVGPRTATRAIEVLQQLGLLCVSNDGPRIGQLGSPTNRYTIVWSELALLVDRAPLARQRKHSAPASEKGEDQSAPAARPERPGGRPERPGGRPERPGGRPERPQGAQNVSSNVQEAQFKRRLDVCRDGARGFLGDELAAIREKANTINQWIAATKPEDRELILKIATLWEDGELPEDAVEQVLESFAAKRKTCERLERPCGWLWTTLRSQLARHGVRLEKLLATTDFPRELLPLPAERAVSSPT